MPLRLERSNSIPALWESMTDRFLGEIGTSTGPSGYGAHLWLKDRRQRDFFLQKAAQSGCVGWLGPPFSLWNNLSSQFDLRTRSIGLLTSQLTIDDISRQVLKDCGFRLDRSGSKGLSGNIMSRIFGELLPEGITADDLENHLEELEVKDTSFSARRNDWVARTYRTYLETLRNMGRVDGRSRTAQLAEAIEQGQLPKAIGYAKHLHIYGILHDLRDRNRLVRTLSEQSEVEVTVYVLDEPEPGPWDELGVENKLIDSELESTVQVQPCIDSSVETAWVTYQVKKLLLAHKCEPHEIAVVARSGQRDIPRIGRELKRAHIPLSMQERRSLSQVNALKSFLALFEGECDEWDYPSLRACVASPYLEIAISLRTLDTIAKNRRISGLNQWTRVIEDLLESLSANQESAGYEGLSIDNLRLDLNELNKVIDEIAWMQGNYSHQSWIDQTLKWLKKGPFGFRDRICAFSSEDPDQTRIDQKGVLKLEELLREWLELADDKKTVPIIEWRRSLETLLQSEQLLVRTAMDKGVQVLEAETVGLTPFKHTFLIHANRGEFPKRTPRWTVFTDEERRALSAAGLRLRHREENERREKTIWRGTTATSRTHISYRESDSRGGDLSPSQFIEDNNHIYACAQSLGKDYLWTKDPISVWDEHLQAAKHLADDPRNSGRLLSSDPDRLRHVILAAYAENQRTRTRLHILPSHPGLQPNPWNGDLSKDKDIREHLSQVFGRDRIWSASQLEVYGQCPFQFLIERVLGITEHKEAEEDTSLMTIGRIQHDILKRFYVEFIGDIEPPAEFDESAAELLDQILEEVSLAESERSDNWVGEPVFWRGNRKEIKNSIRNFLTLELPYLARKNERPAGVELEFGMNGGLELSGSTIAGENETILLRGYIDRIDAVLGKDTHLVLDYKKKGTPEAKGYTDGSVLQIPLYMLAAIELGFNPAKGLYRAIEGQKETISNKAIANLDTEKTKTAIGFAFSFPGFIRKGLFPPLTSQSLRQWPLHYCGIEIARSRGTRLEDFWNTNE